MHTRTKPGQPVWLTMGLLLFVTLGALAADPKRVLILESFGRDVAPFNRAGSVFKTTLARDLGAAVDFCELSLDLARFGDAAMEAATLDYLKGHLRLWPSDLVVPIGAPAARFVTTHREELFPATPIVFTGADPRLVAPDLVRTNATLVTQVVDLRGIVADMLQLRPETTNIVVVFGDSPLERFWVGECQKVFQRYTNRVTFTWLNELPLDEMERRVRGLPPHSFVFFGLMIRDAARVPYEGDQALRRICAAANAPVYGYFASQFGSGIVGGRLYQIDTVGAAAAAAAIRILRGTPAGSISPRLIQTPDPVYDGRELRRWNISPNQLSADSRTEFRLSTAWERYRWKLLGVLAVCLIEALLIGMLISVLVGRRRAEQMAKDLSQRLINVQEQERARLARELHDDITQRLALLAIDAAQLERARQQPTFLELSQAMRQQLVRLSEDVHALSYRLHPALLEDLGLAAALKSECDQFARREAIPVAVKLAELPDRVPREHGLSLFRILQEALQNITRHAKARRVEVSLRYWDGGLQLAVRDDGLGFDSATHRRRPSLGIASMTERLRLLGGELDIDTSPGHGTTILAWVPLQKGHK